jgi:hypothetical protein
MGEIIKNYNDVDKAELVSDVYYLGNSIWSQRQDDDAVIQPLIKGMDDYDAIRGKRKKI